jgi:hypothetical protein
MAESSFVQRAIDVSIRLGQGSFGDSGYDTVKLTGLRVQAQISKAGSVGMNTLNLKVWGAPLSVMNKVSTLGKTLIDGRNNVVTLEAGDVGGNMATAFVGTIDQAWSDFQGAPEAALVLSAHTGLIDALRPLPPVSYENPVDVATIMSGLAQQMGYSFENSNVSVQLAAGVYLCGTGRQQAYTAAQMAGINLSIDDQTLAIWPKSAARTGVAVSLSAKAGLVGYPQWTDKGIKLRTLYNPNLVFGSTVSVNSIVLPAEGSWTIFKLTHLLDSQMLESSNWFSDLECSVLGHAIPVS